MPTNKESEIKTNIDVEFKYTWNEFFFIIWYDIFLFFVLIFFGFINVSDEIYGYTLAGTIVAIMIGPIILNRIVKKKSIY